MLFLGSCGLHVINGSLTTGHKTANWKVQVQLKSFFKLFKDSPARRADYIDFTGCDQFPKKFCSVRWVENVEVCERALEVFKHIKLYISKAKNLPNTFAVKAVKEASADPLAEAKIAFFCSLASALEPFLRRFQTDALMAPFLHAELFNVLLVLMKRVIKRDLMDKAITPQQLRKLDANSKGSLKEPKGIDVGTKAKSFLSRASISANEKLIFRKECRDFLVATVAEIFEKSPLRHKITRAVASIVPATMINARSTSEKRMEILVQILFDRKWLSAVVADKAEAQFSQLCSQASEEWLQMLTSFDWNKERLDVFYHKAIGSKEEFKEIWSVFQIVFILSHGNALVESGFSVKADMLVENLKEESLREKELLSKSKY